MAASGAEMILFEFVSVMASIVLGLSLAIFIQGAATAARTPTESAMKAEGAR